MGRDYRPRAVEKRCGYVPSGFAVKTDHGVCVGGVGNLSGQQTAGGGDGTRRTQGDGDDHDVVAGWSGGVNLSALCTVKNNSLRTIA